MATADTFSITLGSETIKDVKGLRLLPGLFHHDAIHYAGMRTITHELTGLALVNPVDPADLEDVRDILAAVDWVAQGSRIPEEFLEQAKYTDALAAARHRAFTDRVHALMAKSSKERSMPQELRIAHDTGGVRQPASGSRWGRPRDVITPILLIEAKTTESDAFRLEFDDVQHLRVEAAQRARVPAYCVQIGEHPDIVVMFMGDIVHLLPALKDCKMTSMFGTKGLRLTDSMAASVTAGAHLCYRTSVRPLAIIGYEPFLELARGGLDA